LIVIEKEKEIEEIDKDTDHGNGFKPDFDRALIFKLYTPADGEYPT
jgi:hypothetical protein